MPNTKLRGISVEEPFCRSPLSSLWRLACGDRAAPGSPRSSRQTAGLTPAHDPNHTDRWKAPRTRRADGPCEEAYSIWSRHSHRCGRKTADRQEGRGRACLCVVRLPHRSRRQGLRARLRLVLASVHRTALTPALSVCWRPSTQAIPPVTTRRE